MISDHYCRTSVTTGSKAPSNLVWRWWLWCPSSLSVLNRCDNSHHKWIQAWTACSDRVITTGSKLKHVVIWILRLKQINSVIMLGPLHTGQTTFRPTLFVPVGFGSGTKEILQGPLKASCPFRSLWRHILSWLMVTLTGTKGSHFVPDDDSNRTNGFGGFSPGWNHQLRLKGPH